MNASRKGWAIGIASVALLGLVSYGLRTEGHQPAQIAQHTTIPVPASEPRDPAVLNPPAPNSGSVPTPSATPAAASLPNFVELVQTVKPAVVSIRVKSDVTPQVATDDGAADPFERFFRQFGQPGQEQGQQGPQRHFYAQGQGSGFFVSADGYVVTNNHVVDKAIKVDVVMDDGTVLTAKVVGTDPKTDVALVKVEGGRKNFPFVRFADDPSKIGEWVIAMGNPFGLGGTVTSGIVSAQGRDIGSGPYDDFMQIDAAVNRGNSGGPTFNMAGKVVGVNTAIYSPSGGSVGIAFDIPASTVKSVISQLKSHGFVERGWIGVQVQSVTKEIAESLGMSEATGALLSGTEPSGPAAKAGLRAGDVVVSIDGSTVKDSRDLARKIAAVAPNTTVKVGFVREGKTQTANVTLSQLGDRTALGKREHPQEDSQRGEQPSNLGIAVAPASRVMGIGAQGLTVVRVDPNGKAAEIGLAPGDIILKVGSREMQNSQDLVKALDEARGSKRYVLARIKRNDRELFVALPVTAG